MQLIPRWRREALRTTLWFVPSLLVAAAAGLFAATNALDRAAYRGALSLPAWIHPASADAGRQVLIAVAAAVITVVGVVFSITILALTLASQQFGPRMLRTFIRDPGTQISLGIFVATCVYALLALVSIGPGGHGEFVPALAVGLTEALALGDLVVLIYFVHHIAVSIQLPGVIAGIARDLGRAINAEYVGSAGGDAEQDAGALAATVEALGAAVPAARSGYLQFVGHGELVAIAARANAVILLAHRPGHFIVAGSALAHVHPPEAAGGVAARLARAHVTGPHRTLTQDPVFAVDQLVEIAIRALSPAVNDTFTALTCIDWLSDGLCQMSVRQPAPRAHRDAGGVVRVIEPPASYDRIVDRAFDKIRQAGRGMPAVAVRQLRALAAIAGVARVAGQRGALLRQGAMILRSAEEAVPEEEDRARVRTAYDLLSNSCSENSPSQ